MGTFSKIILSGSTDGEGIAVAATSASGGTVIHTAVTGAADSIDEVWLYAFFGVTTTAEISLAIGPTTATGSRLTFTVSGGDKSGLHTIYPGLPLRNAKVIKAFATTANIINVFGHVNRFVS